MKEPAEIEMFLSSRLVSMLSEINPETKPVWGVMNVWQMIEHLAWPFKASNGTIEMPLTTAEDKIERVKGIGLLNDRPLQRLFNNPLLTDEFKKIRNSSIEGSLTELQQDINSFMTLFRSKDEGFTVTHNIFGPLTYNEWLQFHYKHARHHLEQFGVII